MPIDSEVTIMKKKKMPPQFWEDQEWALDHYERWMTEYPYHWIAVVNEEVVAAEKDPEKARKIAQEKTGRKHIPVVYIEGHIHVY
jgi:glutaredoxin